MVGIYKLECGYLQLQSIVDFLSVTPYLHKIQSVEERYISSKGEKMHCNYLTCHQKHAIATAFK